MRIALLLAATLTVAACRTTHDLGSSSDMLAPVRVREIMADGPAYAVIAPANPRQRPSPAYPVASVENEGLRLRVGWPEPALVPMRSIKSVSRYDHGRGALEGLASFGLPAWILSTAILVPYALNMSTCSDGCYEPHPVLTGLAAGAVLGLAAGIVGAGIGAIAGHEDRYVFTDH